MDQALNRFNYHHLSLIVLKKSCLKCVLLSVITVPELGHCNRVTVHLLRRCGGLWTLRINHLMMIMMMINVFH